MLPRCEPLQKRYPSPFALQNVSECTAYTRSVLLTQLQHCGLQFAMLRLDDDRMLLERCFLLGDIGLYRALCQVHRPSHENRIYLQLVDLPLLVVLEVVHVFLQLLDLRLRGLLLLLRSFNGSAEVGDRLLRLLYLLADLMCRKSEGDIHSAHTLSLPSTRCCR